MCSSDLKGSPQVLTALVAGEIQLYFIASAGTVVPQEKAGRVRAIGVSTKQRLPILPHVPPIADALPGYEAIQWYGVLAPAKTAREIVNKLQMEIARILVLPEVKERLAADGADAVGNRPDEFAAYIRAELTKWNKVVKTGGIKLE